MNRPRKSSKKQAKKKSSAKSAIYIIILVAALAVIGFYFLGEFGFRNDYNSAVKELDEGFQSGDEKTIKECMTKLETLKKSNLRKKERLDPINDHLVKCYRHISANPGLSHKERVEYLKKIYAIAPNSLSEMDKKFVE